MGLLTRREERAWDPFKELREMSDRLNKVFGSDPFFGRHSTEGQSLTGVDWRHR